MARILLVDPDPAALSRFVAPLLRQGHVVFAAIDADEADEIQRVEVLDLALVAMRLGELSGLTLLERLRRTDPDMDVVLLSDDDGARLTVRAMRLGAGDVISRGETAESILRLVGSALRQRELRREVSELRSRAPPTATSRFSSPARPESARKSWPAQSSGEARAAAVRW